MHTTDRGDNAIVKRIATRNFERVNAKDHDALLKGCAPDIHHRFAGDHPLGGERHDEEALRRWFERLMKVFAAYGGVDATAAPIVS